MKINTQLKLIETATTLFAMKGFAGVSIREITDSAQVNVSAISYYFSGKEGLYQAVLEEQFTPLRQALQLVSNNHSLPPIERLTLYANQISHIHAQRPFLSRFMNSEVVNPTENGGPIIEKQISKVYEFMHEVLQAGVDSGDFQPDLNITYAAISLVGILNFYFICKPLIQKFIHFSPDANTEYTANAFHIYLHGIKKE